MKHAEARKILDPILANILGRPSALYEMQFTQAVGYLESHYGEDYADANGASKNWGSVHCKTPHAPCPDCWVAQDISPKTGQKYSACFKIYPDDHAGAEDYSRHLWKRARVRAAVPSRNTYLIADAMERDKYFVAVPEIRERRVRRYAQTIYEVGNEIARSLREPFQLSMQLPPTSETSSAPSALGDLALPIIVLAALSLRR